MRITKKLFKAGAVLALITNLHAGGEGWTSDFNAAKQQAAKEGKDLLIDFTGSDWCGWCIKLSKEVFQHEAFKEGVKDKFVLVELDFPRDKSKIDEATQKQNQQLAEKYEVSGYPTILLTDANGRPYAKTGYRKGGPKAYVSHLDELQAIRAERDEHLAAAEKLEGVEKAKALVSALQALRVSDSQIAEFYGDVVEEIKAADPEDASGYLKGIEEKKRMADFGRKLNQLAREGDLEGALKLVDDRLENENPDPEMTQRLVMTKAMIFVQMSRYNDSLTQIDKAIAANPESPNNAGIQKMRKQVVEAKQKAEAAADKAEAPKEKQ